MSKKLFIRGTLLLTFSGLLSRLAGFFYRIFLSHTIGAQGLGIFQLTVPLQLLFMSLCASGIQTGISRLTASAKAQNHSHQKGDYFVCGAVFSVVLSVILACQLCFFGDFWAKEILKEPETLGLLRLLAFSLPPATLHACINSYYFGIKKAGIPSAIQLLEQFSRIGGCYLIYWILLSQNRPVTPLIAAGGNLIGEAVAAFLSLFLISMHFHLNKYTFFCQSQKVGLLLKKFFNTLKKLFPISVPLTLNKVLLTVLAGIEVLLIPDRLRLSGLSRSDSLEIYGIFTGMALPLILFPSTLTNSVSVMLLPSIAELQALGCQKRIRYVIRRILGCCTVLGIGCMFLFFIMGQFLGIFLFHNTTAGICIQALSFVCPFLYLNTTLTSILNGLGKSGLCLLYSSISICIRVAFVLLVIPLLGIQGYFCGLLLSEMLLTILLLVSTFRT